MECFECVRTCPTDAFEMDKSVSCVRFERSEPLSVVDEKCNECNQCNEVCPMGNIALSAVGCSFCIICKSHPGCLLSEGGKVSFLNFITHIMHYLLFRCRIIFQ